MYEVIVHMLDVSDDKKWKEVNRMSFGEYDEEVTAIAKVAIVKADYQRRGWRFEDSSKLGINAEISEERLNKRICIGIKRLD